MRPDTLSARTIVFVNIAHAFDHFILLIYPTAVIAIAAQRGLDYGTLINLATGAFVAFGLFSLPMGWIADHVGRRNMLAVFFLGYGASCAGLALAETPTAFAEGLLVVGIFSAIYRPIGSAMLVSHARQLGRDLGWNGVWGNLGAASASAVTAVVAATLGWRWAFVLPGLVSVIVGTAFIAMVPSDGGDSLRHSLRGSPHGGCAERETGGGAHAAGPPPFWLADLSMRQRDSSCEGSVPCGVVGTETPNRLRGWGAAYLR